MAASFGSFTYAASEYPQHGTYNGWSLSPSIERIRPLGSSRDDVVYMARGSRALTFENLLSAARFATAEALLLTTATFTDFDSPTPGTRSALLVGLVQVGSIVDTTVTANRIVRVRWDFVEQ